VLKQRGGHGRGECSDNRGHNSHLQHVYPVIYSQEQLEGEQHIRGLARTMCSMSVMAESGFH